jgi:hypothetical protein
VGLRIRRLLAVGAIVSTPVLVSACGSTPTSAHHPAGASVRSDPLDSTATAQTLNQVQTDLRSVDDGLSQVSSDLANPQSDS